MKHPCDYWLEWSSTQKCLLQIVKGTKERIPVLIPFTFLTLETLTTITGYSQSEKSGIWSNEIKEIQTDILTVKTNKGIIAQGIYAEIKPKIKALGGNYTMSLYIAYFDSAKSLQLGCIKLSGYDLSSFLEYKNSTVITRVATSINGYNEVSNDYGIFNIPTFKEKAISEETKNKSLAIEKKLQEYLTDYFAKNK